MKRPIRSNVWLHIAVVYFVIAVGLGIAMGATKNFTLMPVHMHLDFLGWVATSLIGLATARFPQLGEGYLATVQFWLYNLGVPVFLLSLATSLGGYPQAQTVAAVALVAVALSVMLLACQACLCIRVGLNKPCH